MRIRAISISDRKGMRKKNITETVLVAGHGLKDDAHAGGWHRQVSLLAEESIASMRAKGLTVVAGNFAENITTEGIDLTRLQVGQHLHLGACEVIISQLGKVCHKPCAIFHQAGDCVMPREGVFAVVIKGGALAVGDRIELPAKRSTSVAVILSKEDAKAFGEQLNDTITKHLQPGFVRFDQLSDQEENLQPILTDLSTTQKVDTIILYDQTGRHSSDLACLVQVDSPRLFCCRSLAELDRILGDGSDQASPSAASRR